jgi:hypothetical protein
MIPVSIFWIYGHLVPVNTVLGTAIGLGMGGIGLKLTG